ncbi:MAG TPA: DUF4831 domain-containing protein [Porphyromonadaceae bacterium]|nr:DUF4831 domain-containing protein [Porphyromonadaceae bacterium]
MRSYFAGLFLCFSLSMMGQFEVIPLSESKGKEQGLVYSLPKTALQVKVTSVRCTYKVGQCYEYAERYLGKKSSVLEDNVVWELESIAVLPKGVPDEERSFFISFRSTPAPTIDITPDGILRSINTPYPNDVEKNSAKNAVAKEIEEDITDDELMQSMTEELLSANSAGKMAEIAAREIYDIRETRNDLVLGKLDNMPSDGESYKLMLKQLEDRERALSSLFYGRVKKERKVSTFSLIPTKEMERKVVFRFSKHLGVLSGADLAGSPLYITLKIINKQDFLQNPTEEKLRKGLYYLVPTKVNYKIFDLENHTYVEGDCLVGQMGTMQSLSPNLFDKKNPLKVVFDPSSGAIRQMAQ